MRLHEAASDEPGLISQCFDLGHGGCCNLPIGLILIRAIRRPPLTPVQGAPGDIATFKDLFASLRGFIGLRCLPGLAQIHPSLLGLNVLAATQMKQLSKRMRLPASHLKKLR